jgi:hypothetical protein
MNLNMKKDTDTDIDTVRDMEREMDIQRFQMSVRKSVKLFFIMYFSYLKGPPPTPVQAS